MRTLLVFACAVLAASADPVTVLTDVAWKAKARPEKEWTGADYDDADWVAANQVEGPSRNGDHYSVKNTFGFDSKASWLWNGNGDNCSFRRTFKVPAGFKRAEMMYFVDDVGEVWINGESADKLTCRQFGQRGSGTILDLLPWIREGTNVIAVHGTNLMGPCGFAAEIRIDGEPFFGFAAPRAGQPLLPEVTAALKDFARHLDAEEVSVRMAAEAALLVLSRENGAAVIEAVAKEVASGSPEAKARAAHLGEVLHEDLWKPKDGPDARWAFAHWTPDQIKTILSAEVAQQWSILRLLVAVRVRAESDPEGMLAVLGRAAEDGDVVLAERAVRVIVGAELAGGADNLREVIKARPDSRAGTFAAAGLARMGNADDIPALEKAAACGNAATERAAKEAVRLLKK